MISNFTANAKVKSGLHYQPFLDDTMTIVVFVWLQQKPKKIMQL